MANILSPGFVYWDGLKYSFIPNVVGTPGPPGPPGPSTGPASGDLLGNYPSPAVVKLQGNPISSNSISNDGYALVSRGSTWTPQGVLTTLNVKTFGAKGDGIHDDTAAIQAAINMVSGGSNPNTQTIFIPYGQYNISSTLTYTGSVGNSIRMIGDNSGVLEGSQLIWTGAADGYMMETFGANQCEFEYLIFNGSNTAFTCFWAHTNQFAPGGSPSNGIFFNKCYLYGAVGQNPQGLYAGTQGVVMIGDVNDGHQVQDMTFTNCVFGSNGFDGPTGTFACVNQLSGSNTEQFVFRNCDLGTSGMMYGYYSNFGSNNGISFYDSGFGLVAGACVHVNGTSTVLMFNTGCENGLLPAPYTGKGYFFESTSQDIAYISGSEITMDVSNNLYGALITTGGKLVLENVKVDGSAEVGNQFLGTIALSNPYSLANGTSSAIVRSCIWAYASTQIPIVDSNGNNLTVYNNGFSDVGQGMLLNSSIILHNNSGTSTDGSLHIALPNFDNSVNQLFSSGLYFTTPFPAGFSVHNDLVSSPRIVQTVVTIDASAFASTASMSTSISAIKIPERTKIIAIVADVTTAFSGSGISTITLEVGDGYNGASAYLLPHTIAATTKGIKPIGASLGDLGTLLANPVQGGYYYWIHETMSLTDLQFTFTSTGANLDLLTQGSVNIYITSECLR